MASVPCPRCGMLLELEQIVCSHCRTPRDDMEIEEGRARLQKEELIRRRKPKIVAVSIAAFTFLCAGWFMRDLLIRPVARAWHNFLAEVEKTRQPSHWLKDQPLPPNPEPAPTTAVASAVSVSSYIYLNATPEPLPAPVQPPPPPEALAGAPPTHTLTPVENIEDDPPRELAPGEIRVYGTVYDLATTKPVKAATVKLSVHQGHARWETTTDEAGRYELYLYKSPADTLIITVAAPGYRDGLLEDRDPPYRERSTQSRADLIAETIDSDLEPVPIRYRPSDPVVALDLVLVPLAAK